MKYRKDIFMKKSIKEIIRTRRSVRTFNNQKLSLEDKKKLQEYMENVDNPFQVPVKFYILDAKEHDLSSPVIIGTDLYIAAKVKWGENAEIAFGYSFEKVCLYAESLGIGTVMLAATMSRKTFEKAIDLQDDEIMFVVSPIGYPSEKKSVRETLMRKSIKADERLPFETLFFDKSLTHPLTLKKAGQFQEALEMVRLAPSAANRQPWRIIVNENQIHFYEKKAKAMSHQSLGDIQKVDIGIALAHFDLTMKENGIDGYFDKKEPHIDIDDTMEYVISYQLI